MSGQFGINYHPLQRSAVPYPYGTGIPTQWIPNWYAFTNLTDDQITAYEAFPQDLVSYTSTVRNYYQARAFPQNMSPMPNPYITVNTVPIYPNDRVRGQLIQIALSVMRAPTALYNLTINGTVYHLTSAQAAGLLDGLNSYDNQARTIEANTINGINATPPTITTRAQIDAAFAVLN
jgi:hypothetical protein